MPAPPACFNLAGWAGSGSRGFRKPIQQTEENDMDDMFGYWIVVGLAIVCFTAYEIAKLFV